jgi:hypothetical protein
VLNYNVHIIYYPGLSWRWGLAAAEDGKSVELQLQALPCDLNTIKGNPAFARDGLAVIVLAAYPVYCQLFDGDVGAGPVPVLFSSKPEEIAAQLRELPAAAHKLSQAISTRLTTTETLTSSEALELGATPREGKTVSPFTRSYREAVPPPTKRAKPAEPSGPVGDLTGT